MKNRILMAVAVVALVCVVGSTTLGAYIGPPKSMSTKGQLGLNLGYSYSKNDLRIVDTKWESPYPSMTLNKIRSQEVFADLTYGVTENVEAFVRLGVTETGEGAASSWGGTNGTRLTGDTDFSWGWGLRATFYKDPKISWGGVFTMNHVAVDATMEIDDYGTMYRGRVGIDGWEYFLSVGPTYRLTDNCSIYGGPFLYYMDSEVNGHVDDDYRFTGDVEAETIFGGMVGLQVDICDSSDLCIEYAHSNDVDSLSLAWAYRHK